MRPLTTPPECMMCVAVCWTSCLMCCFRRRLNVRLYRIECKGDIRSQDNARQCIASGIVALFEFRSTSAEDQLATCFYVTNAPQQRHFYVQQRRQRPRKIWNAMYEARLHHGAQIVSSQRCIGDACPANFSAVPSIH